MNARSSRSHSLFILKLYTERKNGIIYESKLNLVDLAGSERISKSKSEGKSLKEAVKINVSLSVLGHCILALSENLKHIPFRESKLTQILKESLGGNAYTTLLCTVSRRRDFHEETIDTIHFAQRAKKIECVIRKNKRYSVEQ